MRDKSYSTDSDSFLQGKTVAVIGAGGFIGSHLVEALLLQNAMSRIFGVTTRKII